MKEYWEIPGPSSAPIGNPCLAFKKLDGSNIRYESNEGVCRVISKYVAWKKHVAYIV